MTIYGWSVEKKVGGVALPVIMMFSQGVAQLFCFSSLSTYCLDVMPGRSSEVIGKFSRRVGAPWTRLTNFLLAGNYMVRYIFAALGSAVCLPAIRKIGT
jgi:hypothetical protein